MILKLHTETRLGNGYWKLNTSLLENSDYITLIKINIGDVKIEMASVSPRLLWDFCKLRIKEVSIEFASKITKQRKNEFRVCEKRLEELDKLLESKLSQSDHLSLNLERNEVWSTLDEYYKNEAIGNAIWARMKHIECCDKNTKFLFNLEKKHQTNNVISSIFNTKGNILNKSEHIVDEGANYNRNFSHFVFTFWIS